MSQKNDRVYIGHMIEDTVKNDLAPLVRDLEQILTK